MSKNGGRGTGFTGNLAKCFSARGGARGARAARPRAAVVQRQLRAAGALASLSRHRHVSRSSRGDGREIMARGRRSVIVGWRCTARATAARLSTTSRVDGRRAEALRSKQNATGPGGGARIQIRIAARRGRRSVASAALLMTLRARNPGSGLTRAWPATLRARVSSMARAFGR